MGAVRDRSVVGIEEAKAYAKAQSGAGVMEDALVGIILTAAKERADYICNNPFYLEDSEGNPIANEDGDFTPLPIPMGVELWVLRKFVKNYTYRLAGSNKENAADIGSFTPDEEDWRELVTFIKFD